VPQDRAVVLGKDFLRREAGEMDDSPEAIASSGKMMSYGGRSHSGIDPAEDHRKPSGDDITNSARVDGDRPVVVSQFEFSALGAKRSLAAAGRPAERA
jgi:hypothetical protein